MKNPFAISGTLAALALPMFAFAQTFNGSVLGKYMSAIIDFINSYVVPFIWAIAFIVFIWGIFQYFIMGGANEEARDKGKQLAMWGIIGFVVMTCLWGLVNLLTNTFGFGNQNAPKLPEFKPSAQSTQTTNTPGSGTYGPKP